MEACVFSVVVFDVDIMVYLWVGNNICSFVHKSQYKLTEEKALECNWTTWEEKEVYESQGWVHAIICFT